MLGIEIPIVQAPMGGAVPAGFAAAVSNAGALGTLPLWRADRETLRDMVRKTRALTPNLFAVNLNMEFPQEDRLEVCLMEGVPVISFFWRDPDALVNAPRPAAPVSSTPQRRRRQASPSMPASMSSWPRDGRPVATSAGRWRRCRSCLPSSTPSARFR